MRVLLTHHKDRKKLPLPIDSLKLQRLKRGVVKELQEKEISTVQGEYV